VLSYVKLYKMLINQENNMYITKKIFVKSYITILRHNKNLLIKGPLGVLVSRLPTNIFFKKKDFGFQLFALNNCKNLVLTYSKLLYQKVRGVELGFFEVLIVQGIGWRVLLEDQILKFSIGFSHSIKYILKPGIEVIIFDKQCFKVFGLDLVLVQQVVADLCHLRSFNIYKGKGIYKRNQVFKLKVSSKSKA
jgi:ribosomal protein L6P/L9E